MEIYEAEDCRRIVNVLEKNGYIVTMEEAHELWQKHSTDYCAGWLMMDDKDEDLFKILEKTFNIEVDNYHLIFKQL